MVDGSGAWVKIFRQEAQLMRFPRNKSESSAIIRNPAQLFLLWRNYWKTGAITVAVLNNHPAFQLRMDGLV
jgi:hypothetical protein